MNSKYLLLGILLLFFLIIITYEIYEGFVDNHPVPVGAAIRDDKTCSDADMSYMIDRFDKVFKAVIENGVAVCPSGTTPYPYPKHVALPPVGTLTSNNHPGTILYCLPECATYGPYIQYSNDITFCVRSDNRCGLNRELSNTIKDNWARICGPLYKTNLNLLSTMGSISTVVSTINTQYATINTNFPAFSNSIILNESGLEYNEYLRNTIFNVNIISNYYDLTSLNNNVTSYWNELSNKKNRFNGVFNSLNCANYM